MKFNRVKTAIIIAAIMLLACASTALALDPPHDKLVNCNSCHDAYGLNRDSGGSIDNTSMNMLCTDCHNPSGLKPKKTHSSTTTDSESNYGPWTTQCVDCHNPHYQSTLRYYRGDYSTDTGAYLETGLITGFANKGGIANVVNVSVNLGTEKYAGAMLLPNYRTPVFYKIVNATGNSITTDVAVTQGAKNAFVGGTFKIGYGMLVQGTVRAPRTITNSGGVTYDTNTFRTVKFFNTAGPHSAAYTLTDTQAICIVCHTRTKAFNIGYATYGQSYDGTVGYTTQPHKDRVSDTTNGACWSSTSTCHVAPKDGFDANCGGCHGQPPVDAATMINTPSATNRVGSFPATPSGKHQQHVVKGITDCNYCHAGGAGTDPTHTAGNYLNLGFTHGLSQGNYIAPSPGGTYSLQNGVGISGTIVTTGGAIRQCSNIYCHSDGSNYAGSFTFRTANWDSGSALQCDGCHGDGNNDGAGQKVSTDSHIKHVYGSYTFACYECHNNTVDAASAIKAGGFHVNAAKDIAFGNLSSGGDAYETAGAGKCSNIYCHSNGQGGAPLTAPTWAATLTGCVNCHDDKDAGAGTTLSAAHSVHTLSSGNNYGCADCHLGTVNNDTTIPAGKIANHVNAVKNVYVNPTRGGDGTDYSGGSCATTNCHGGASPTWSTDLSAVNQCTKCHGDQADATANKAAPGLNGVGKDTDGNNLAADAQVGAHNAHLKSASNYTNDVACSSCHAVPGSVNAAGHIDTARPAELTFDNFANNFGNTTSSYTGGTCSNTYCHGGAMPNGSDNGSDPTPTWNDTAYLSGSPSTAGDCGKCHGAPPSGAGYSPNSHSGSETIGNCSGCHQHLNNDGTFNNASLHMNGVVEASGCTGCHGQPPVDAGTLVNNPAVTGHTAGAHATHWTKYSASGCSICHSGGGAGGHTSAYKVTMGFTYGLNQGAYSATNFSNGFVAVSGHAGTSVTNSAGARTCTNIYCHSNAQNNGGTAAATSFATPDWDGSVACASCHGNPPSSGKHATHVTTAGYVCNDCHNGAGSGTAQHVNVLIEFGFLATNAGSASSYSQGTHAPGSGGYGTCSNTYCHGNFTGGANSTPNWGDASAACGSCHNATATTPPTSNAHPRHAGNGAGQRNLACSECHGTIASDHVDFSVAWSMNTSGVAGAGAVYTNSASGSTGAKAPSATFGECDNTYCHSDVQADGGNAGPQGYTAVPWDNGPVTCGTCHQVPTATGSHTAHISAGRVCNDCHDGAGFRTSSHADGLLEFGFLVSNSGSSGAFYNQGTHAPGSGGYGTCGNTNCHSNVQADGGASGPSAWGTPTWGAASTCSDCHGDVPATGKHATHVTTLGFLCNDCHNGAGAGTGLHGNGIINFGAISSNATSIVYGQDGSIGSNGYSTCSNTYCHGNYTNGNNATPNWGGTAACGSCHNATATTPPNTVAHNRHAGNGGAWQLNRPCTDCHGATAGASGHMNFNVAWNLNISNSLFGANAKYRSLASGTTGAKAKSATYGTCSNTYCHSNVQNNGGTAGPSSYATPTWDGAVACGSCHTATPASGSHVKHVTTAGYLCADCHNGAGTGTTKHANRTINFGFSVGNAGGSASYTQGDHTPGSGGYGSCSSTNCHGVNSSNWGTVSGFDTCTLCHGVGKAGATQAEYAPGYNGTGVDTGGATSALDAQVGAHDAHLRDPLGIYNSAGVSCNECHTVPATYASAGHFDTYPGAEVPLDGAMATNGTTDAGMTTYNSGAGTCSNTYCHDSNYSTSSYGGGNGITPVWNNTSYLTGVASNDCAKCHGYPPGSGHSASTDCSGCHPHVDGADGSFSGIANRALHINGKVEGGGCDGCHAYPPRTGDGKSYMKVNGVDVAIGNRLGKSVYAHQKHVDHLATLAGVTNLPDNRTWNDSVVQVVCGTCHQMIDSSTNHNTDGNGTRTIVMNSTTYTFGPTGSAAYNGTPGTATTKSCSNVNCHYRTTPEWQNPSTEGQ